MINREAIYSALWARVTAAVGFATASRRLKHWADVPAEAQPALFMSQTGERAATKTGEPTIWALRVDLYLYATEADPTASPAVKLNALIDAVAGALQPDTLGTGRCTLGGLVHYARIEGDIQTDEGTLGSQAVAIVPIQILVGD